MRLKVAVWWAVVVVLISALPAWGHGEFETSDPAADATLRKVPKVVSITLTEAPGPGATMRVSDGCDRNVVTDISRSGEVLKARLEPGQPGRWQVRFRAVSAVDGHTTRDAFGFRVSGRRDCSPEKEKTDVRIGGGEDTVIESDDPPSNGSGFPIVPFAIGSLVLIGVAFLVRRLASR